VIHSWEIIHELFECAQLGLDPATRVDGASIPVWYVRDDIDGRLVSRSPLGQRSLGSVWVVSEGVAILGDGLAGPPSVLGGSAWS
jgi:hypothetical protein